MVRTWSPEIEQLGERIVSLTLAGAAELRQYLEEEHGLRPSTTPLLPTPDPVVVVDPPLPREEFTVRLEGCDSTRKIAVIKEVRQALSLGLKQAKDLVDQAPQDIAKDLPTAEAEDLKTRLEAAGAQVSLI